MAVIPGVPGVSVNIRVGGGVAAEYSAPQDDGPRYPNIPNHCCYIESRTGETFVIEAEFTRDFKILDGRDAIAASIYIDGTVRTAAYFLANKLDVLGTQKLVRSDVEVKSNTPGMNDRCKFMFAPVTTVEDHNSAKLSADKKMVKKLGTIKVDIWAAVDCGVKKYDILQGHSGPDFQVAEKAMKGRDISHVTSLLFASSVRSNGMRQNLSYKTAICRFLFIYRSRDALKCEMIIPHSPSPSPSSAEIENLSPGRIRALARDMLRLKHGNLKSEDSIVPERSGSVKRERTLSQIIDLDQPIRPFKLTKLRDGTEAIDLTED